MNRKEAEHLRLFIKESRWAIAHLEAYYERTKPKGAPKVEEAPKGRKQLSIFEEEENETKQNQKNNEPDNDANDI